MVSGEDITEKRLNHNKLKLAHNSLEKTLDNAPFGVAIIDRKKKIKWVNKTVLKLAGVEKNTQLCGILVIHLFVQRNKMNVLY